MNKLRVTIVVPSVGAAMGPLVHALAEQLKAHVDLTLIVPERYPYEQPGVSLAKIPMMQGRWGRALTIFGPASQFRVVRAVKGSRPDVVHVFNSEGYPWSLSVAAWCASAKVPLLLTLHDPKAHPHDVVAWVNEKLGRITARAAAAIHMFDDGFPDVAAEIGRPLHVVDYVSISHFYKRHEKEGVAREDMVLLFGRLEPYKGIDVLIDAAAYLPAGMKVVIAGPGGLSAASHAKIAAMSERFEVHERFLDDEEVAALFQRASVMVLPYLEVTQSLLHLIAADFEVPTVASDIGYFSREVPRYGGILVPPRDPKALADGIVQARGRRPRSVAGEDPIRGYVDIYAGMASA